MTRTSEHLRRRAPDILKAQELRGPARFFWENPEVAERVKNYPFLFILDEDSRKLPGQGIQVNPWTGTIILPSWREGRSGLARDTEPFHVNPKGKGDVSVRLAEYGSVEQAMRGTIHASEHSRPGGEGKLNAERFMEFAKDLERQFLNGEITRENLYRALNETKALLGETGFGTRAQKPTKRRAGSKVQSAAGPDSLGRINPERSSVMLASAYRDGLHEFLTASMVVDKYDKLFNALATQRMYERMATEFALDDVRDLTSYTGDCHSVFRAKIQDLKETLTEFFRVDTIRTAPYRVPALLMTVGVFGFDQNPIAYAGTRRLPDIISLMVKKAEYDGGEFVSRLQDAGSIEDMLDDQLLEPRQARDLIQDRVEKESATLRYIYELASDWTYSSIKINPPRIRNEKIDDLSV